MALALPSQIDDEAEKHLMAYKVEPLGKILVDWLHLPLPLIGAFFAFLYFGVLLFLHTVVGHPYPSNIRELFQLPSPSYYYPNLIGIAYDLVGNPIYFVLLAYIRSYIPEQFIKLQKDRIIVRKNLSDLSRINKFIVGNQRFLFISIVLIPIIVSTTIVFIGLYIYQPQDSPEKYAIFLTALANYINITIFIQIVYVFLILNHYSFNPRLLPKHPDHCSGTAPFGNLAIVIYLFFFIRAMFQAISLSAGGGTIERALASLSGITNITGFTGFLYLWLLFPILFFLVFDLLIYRPHKVLLDRQKQYLEKSSYDWTTYHHSIFSNLMTTISSVIKPLSGEKEYNLKEDVELLEIWSKLDVYVAEMNTWPISRSSFRIVSVLINPFIPILIPIMVEFFRALSP